MPYDSKHITLVATVSCDSCGMVASRAGSQEDDNLIFDLQEWTRAVGWGERKGFPYCPKCHQARLGRMEAGRQKTPTNQLGLG